MIFKFFFETLTHEWDGLEKKIVPLIESYLGDVPVGCD